MHKLHFLSVERCSDDPVPSNRYRSVRWLDRCIQKHESSGRQALQNLFAIVQGGLDFNLRARCIEEMVKRKDKVPGFAIGGLSGGEEKGKTTTIIQTGHSDHHPMAIRQIYSGKCEPVHRI